MPREFKVGLLIVVSLAVLGAGTFLVGDQKNLFRRKNEYFVRFENVAGLSDGSPVQLNGVNVGEVDKVVLPRNIDERLLVVHLNVDRRFGDRVRADSLARIKTFGLLGDKYIEIISGSATSPVIASGGEIPAAPPTDVEQLIASGEDVVDNVMAISISLRNILARMEAGEGVLGELTTDTDAGRRAKEALVGTLEALRSVTRQIETGDGTLGRLIREDGLAVRMGGALDRLEGVLARLEGGDGAIPALLNDPESRDRVQQILVNMGEASEGFRKVAATFEKGDGLLARLLSDDEYGREVLEDLKQTIENVRGLTEKLDRGDGTVGQLLNDPQIYEAVNDILVGINESKLLRWLIRNRQKKGIKVRYEDTVEGAAPATDETPSPAADPTEAPGDAGPAPS